MLELVHQHARQKAGALAFATAMIWILMAASRISPTIFMPTSSSMIFSFPASSTQTRPQFS